jgi:hypothetical protein
MEESFDEAISKTGLDPAQCRGLAAAEGFGHCSLGPVGADVTIVLAGDSTAEQLIPAVAPAIVKHGWRLVVYEKHECPFSSVQREKDRERGGVCKRANEQVLQDILDLKPDLVLTAGLVRGRFVNAEGNAVSGVDGTVEYWEQLLDAGIQVVVVRETPRIEDLGGGRGRVEECVTRHYRNPQACDVQKASVIEPSETAYWDEALNRSPRATPIDLVPGMCPGDVCPAVIGNVIVSRNATHISGEFSASLADLFERELVSAVRE